MRKEQIKYLELLGYRDTQEDGAILENPSFGAGMARYVWKGDKYADILHTHNDKLVNAVKEAIARKIRA